MDKTQAVGLLQFKKRTLLLSTLMFFVVLPSIFSFGVAAPYIEKDILPLSAGQTYDYVYQLQNMVGDSDMVIRTELILGSEIATIQGDSFYELPAHTKDVPVIVHLVIPLDTPMYTNYTVRVAFGEVPSRKGGISLSSAIEKKFTVFIKQGAPTMGGGLPKEQERKQPIYLKPPTEYTWLIVIVLALLTLFIVYLIFRRINRA